MVARLVRDQEVVGSSPVTSTTKRRKYLPFVFLLLRWIEPTTFYNKTGPLKIAGCEANEIFGEKETQSANASAARNCGARNQPIAATRVQVPSPRPQKDERIYLSSFCYCVGLSPRPLIIKRGPKKSRRLYLLSSFIISMLYSS